MTNYDDIKNNITKLIKDTEDIRNENFSETTNDECTKSLDEDSSQNLARYHYGEMIYHLKQMEHHLEQLMYHESKVKQLENNSKSHNQTSQNFDPIKLESSTLNELADTNNNEKDKSLAKTETIISENTISKADHQRKVLARSLRTSGTLSCKYLSQWENLISNVEDQTAHENNNITDTKINKREIVAESAKKTPFTMVRRRIKQFEGPSKPHRVSSTFESFLESNDANSTSSDKHREYFDTVEEENEADLLKRDENSEKDSEICEINNSHNNEFTILNTTSDMDQNDENCGNNSEQKHTPKHGTNDEEVIRIESTVNNEHNGDNECDLESCRSSSGESNNSIAASEELSSSDDQRESNPEKTDKKLDSKKDGTKSKVTKPKIVQVLYKTDTLEDIFEAVDGV